jgi:PAS domain S-box-containing protein
MVLDANPAACTMFGYRRDEWPSLHARDLLSEEDATQVNNLVAEPRETVVCEMAARRKDGATFSIEMCSFWLENRDRQILVVQVRDISERVVARDGMRKRGEILSAVASAAEYLLSSGDWRQCMTGVLSRTARAGDLSRICMVENVYDDQMRFCMKKSFEWPEVSDSIVTYEWENAGIPYRNGFMHWEQRLRQGALVVAHTSEVTDAEQQLFGRLGTRSFLLAPVFSGDQWQGFLCFHEERYEREWHEEELDALRSLARLAGAAMEAEEQHRTRIRIETHLQETQKLESLAVLAGGVAHDFNNLLMVIHGNAELAHDALPPDSAGIVCLEEIMKTVTEAAELVRQLLAYAGRDGGSRESISLSEIIRDADQLLRALIHEPRRLDICIEDNLPLFYADKNQIRQLLISLVENAAEAAPDDTESVITVKACVIRCTGDGFQKQFFKAPGEETEYICLEVQDEGCGIETEKIDRIFEPFYSTKFTGRGLGLAAAAGIVRRHHGGIRIISEKDGGTSVGICLPAASNEEQALEDPGEKSGAARAGF